MALDKWIAVVFLAISLVYGYAAYTYPLLPFERNMVFLPNTMPMVLSGLGVLLSVIILVTRTTANGDGEPLGDVDISRLRDYQTGQALGLIAAMVVYALALRPIGFIAATTLFLFGTAWILGERKLPAMILSALLGAGCVWYLVQEALGIFLRPLPWFMS
jgi:putative tricarboxylic transport membrane protein